MEFKLKKAVNGIRDKRSQIGFFCLKDSARIFQLLIQKCSPICDSESALIHFKIQSLQLKKQIKYFGQCVVNIYKTGKYFEI